MKIAPSWTAVLSGAFTSLSICLGGGILLALWVGMSGDQSFNLNWVLRLLGIAAVFTGGLTSGRKAKAHGWAHGALAGLLYVFILLLPMVFIFHVPFIWKDVLSAAFLSSFIAAAGGITGINLPSRERRRMPMAGN